MEKIMRLILAVIILMAVSILNAQELGNIQPVGRCYLNWHRALDIQVENDLAYIATGGSGLQILDVSERDNIRKVGFYDRIESANSVCLRDTIAYVAFGVDGLVILDISDPVNPVEISTVGTPDNALFVRHDNNIAYVAASDSGLAIIDISNPIEPQMIGRFPTEQKSLEFCISENFVYLMFAHDSILIVDVSDPESPQAVASYGDRVFGNVVRDGFAFVTDRHSLQIFDLAQPDEPELIRTIDGYKGRYLQLHADSLYISGSTIEVFDVSNPGNPILIHERVSDRNGAPLSRFVISGNHAFFVGDTYNPGRPHCVLAGLRIVRLFTQHNFFESGSYEGNGYAIELALSGNYAYIANYLDGLRIIDFTNVRNPTEIAHVEMYARDVKVVDNIAYIAAGLYGLIVVDVSEPENPQIIGEYDTPFFSWKVSVSEDYACLISNNSGVWFHLVDISNPANPHLLSQYQDGRNYSKCIRTVGDLIFIGGNHLIDVIDVSDRENPQWIAELPARTRSDLFVFEENLFIANGDRFEVLDIADLDSARIISTSYGIGQAEGIAVSGNHAFIVSGYQERYWFNKGRLFAFDVTEPENPVRVGTIRTPGWLTAVCARDNLIFVTDNTNFGIYDASEALSSSIEYEPMLEKFSLFEAYPNPFNSTTTIAYGLPVATTVSLQLYDLSGRMVEIIDEGNRHVGVHQAILNAGDLSSGLYFVQLEASGHVFTQKVMLIK